MNLSRLMILGVLAERGPMHGHQIRRIAELTNAEAWGGITGGALYAELRRLDADGLVRAVRSEQVGRRPARTVYQITDEGRLELVVQRDAALESVLGGADPLSVVLLFAAGGSAGDLGDQLTVRRRRVSGQLETMAAERERLTGQGILSALAIAAFRRGELRLEAELRWHDEFEREIAAAPPEFPPLPGLPAAVAALRVVAGDPGPAGPADLSTPSGAVRAE
jgi:DNA-binding PadR family transcriptional regulator